MTPIRISTPIAAEMARTGTGLRFNGASWVPEAE